MRMLKKSEKSSQLTRVLIGLMIVVFTDITRIIVVEENLRQEPPNKGHFGTLYQLTCFVLYRGVVLSLEVKSIRQVYLEH